MMLLAGIYDSPRFTNHPHCIRSNRGLFSFFFFLDNLRIRQMYFYFYRLYLYCVKYIQVFSVGNFFSELYYMLQ